MVRKQVYIEPAQDEFLKRRAVELAVTEAELVRRGLQLAAQGGFSDPPFDAAAWEEELAAMQERARQFPSSAASSRTWSREELYEDRLGRLSG